MIDIRSGLQLLKEKADTLKIVHTHDTSITTHNPLFAWQSNQIVSYKEMEKPNKKKQLQTSKWPFHSDSEAYQIYYNQSAVIGWKVCDEMSHILVTTVMPVEWRELW